MFSSNPNGPGRFGSGGVRPARASQTSGRKLGLSRAISMIGPPGTFGTPVRMAGSTANSVVPYRVEVA
jgi:hypothetical protein